MISGGVSVVAGGELLHQGFSGNTASLNKWI